MSEVFFMGNIERIKYRFGWEYMPEVIVKFTEKVNEKIIHKLDNDSLLFKIGETIHIKNIGEVAIVNQRRYDTGEYIYDTDYVVETIEDDVTQISLEQSKKQYKDYQLLREKVLNK